MSVSFAEKMARRPTNFRRRTPRSAASRSYFEQLVADLTDKSHRDPKTKLMNFARFTEQLESFLALEQRGRWCAVGLVDITGFKWYNDALGQPWAIGSSSGWRSCCASRCAPKTCWPRNARSRTLDANCTPASAATSSVSSFPIWPSTTRRTPIAERFREAVERYDWTIEDPRLAVQPVRVDVGVVCLRLGRWPSGAVHRATLWPRRSFSAPTS